MKRSQLMILPATKVDEMSLAGYDEIKAHAIDKDALDQDLEQVKRVRRIVDRLIPQTAIFRGDAPSWSWESHVIQSTEVNAFCMPGGKIIVYSGILKKIEPTDAQLAAVLGHEISHALREHGRERLSRETAQNGFLDVLFGINQWDAGYAAAANQFAHVLIGLTYDRTQEIEADEMGLELMARSGYDPAQAVTLWKKMGGLGKSQMPEFLSDHPSDEHREQRLRELLPKVEPLFAETQNSENQKS